MLTEYSSGYWSRFAFVWQAAVFTKIVIKFFFSVFIVLIDQAYESYVHFSPEALCSRYLLTATHCFWSVGISFSYFSLSRASIHWKCEQVMASINSTVQLFTDSITCSKIVMSPPPKDLISKHYVLPYSIWVRSSSLQFFYALNAFFCKCLGFLVVFLTEILRWVKRCIIYEPTFSTTF